MSVKVMISLPDHLVLRMRSLIPSMERSKFIASLLEKEIKSREEALHQCAKEFEAHSSLKNEMLGLDKEFGGDGLNDI